MSNNFLIFYLTMSFHIHFDTLKKSTPAKQQDENSIETISNQHQECNKIQARKQIINMITVKLTESTNLPCIWTQRASCSIVYTPKRFPNEIMKQKKSTSRKKTMSKNKEIGRAHNGKRRKTKLYRTQWVELSVKVTLLTRQSERVSERIDSVMQCA